MVAAARARFSMARRCLTDSADGGKRAEVSVRMGSRSVRIRPTTAIATERTTTR
jgi:hypothetical protein